MPDADHSPVDDAAHDRFVIEQGGATAELNYRLRNGRLILVHTEVPDELEGHGVGGHLVRAAIERAAAEELTVVPWCPFARHWLREHDDVASTVAIDWTRSPGDAPEAE